MKYDDAKFVLAVAASYDNRAPSQAVATAWAFDLGDIARDEAVAAVREHYKANPDTWIKPGHVVEIVKRGRSVGLAHSSRVENAAIEALDPDDPDYDRKYMEAVQAARRAAAEEPEVIPERVAIQGRDLSPEEWAEQKRRGKALVQPVLDEIAAKKVAEDPHEQDIPENLQRAREVARQYKRNRQDQNTDRGNLGSAGGQLLSQINQNRRNTA